MNTKNVFNCIENFLANLHENLRNRSDSILKSFFKSLDRIDTDLFKIRKSILKVFDSRLDKR